MTASIRKNSGTSSSYSLVIRRSSEPDSSSLPARRFASDPLYTSLSRRIFDSGCAPRAIALVGCERRWLPSVVTRGLAACLSAAGAAPIVLSPTSWRVRRDEQDLEEAVASPVRDGGDASNGGGHRNTEYRLFESSLESAAELLAVRREIEAVVLVARAGRAAVADVERAAEWAQAADTPLIGVVYVQSESRIPRWLRRYMGEESIL